MRVYYTAPIAHGESTEPLFDLVRITGNTDESTSDLIDFDIMIYAEARNIEKETDTYEDVWGLV